MKKRIWLIRTVDLVKLRVNNEVFKTKKEAEEEFKKIEKTYFYTDVLVKVSGLTVEEYKENSYYFDLYDYDYLIIKKK